MLSGVRLTIVEQLQTRAPAFVMCFILAAVVSHQGLARFYHRMHRSIELYLNGAPFDESVGEMSAFSSWLDMEVKRFGWRPFRTEWSIFNEDTVVRFHHRCEATYVQMVLVMLPCLIHSCSWSRDEMPCSPDSHPHRSSRFLFSTTAPASDH